MSHIFKNASGAAVERNPQILQKLEDHYRSDQWFIYAEAGVEIQELRATLAHAVDTEEGNWKDGDEPEWMKSARKLLENAA